MKVIKTFVTMYKLALLILLGILLVFFMTIVYPKYLIISSLILFSAVVLVVVVYFSTLFFKELYILSNLGLSLNQAISNGLTTPDLYIDYIKSHGYYYAFGKKHYLSVEKHTFYLIVDTLYSLCKINKSTNSSFDCYEIIKSLRISDYPFGYND